MEAIIKLGDVHANCIHYVVTCLVYFVTVKPVLSSPPK